MKLYLLVIISLISGHLVRRGSNDVLSLDEFLALSDVLANNTMTTVTTIPKSCDDNLNLKSDGTTPCFVLTADKSDPAHLYQALYLTSADADQADGYLEMGIDKVQVVFAKEPSCKIIRYNLEKLADTQIGPGSITISQGNTENVNKGWKVGATVTYKTPFAAISGGASLSVSADYSQSAAKSTSNTIGTKYDIPTGSSCTPHLLRFSILCETAPYQVTYFENRSPVLTRLDQPDPRFPPHRLSPVDSRTQSPFQTLNGCIDLSRV